MQTPMVEILAANRQNQFLGEADHDAFVRRAREERPGRTGSWREMRAIIAGALARPRYALRRTFRNGLRLPADEIGSRTCRGVVDTAARPAATGLTRR